MPRKRRSRAESKELILAAAQSLLLEKGPEALKVAHIAKRAKISHPLILHHLGSADGVLLALQEVIARDIRNQLLDSIESFSLEDDIFQVLSSLSSSNSGRLMAWLVVRGCSPFPPAEEKGLLQVLELLYQKTGRDKGELGQMILLMLFTMYGEAMFGEELRLRLGVEHTEETQKRFQIWLFSLFSNQP